MRIRAALGGIFASAAILGIGWQFGSAAAATFATSATASSGSTKTTASSGSTTPTTTPTASGSTASSTTKSSASGTFVGASESTRFGDVQVQIVVSSGKITDVKALQLTDQGGRSVQISNYAAPILRSEVISAQSAHVDSVSGATYTSDGYLSSAQAAIDKAGL